MNWNAGHGQRSPDHPETGRQATFRETGAEFDPVGSVVLGGDHGVDAFDADFGQGREIQGAS